MPSDVDDLFGDDSSSENGQVQNSLSGDNDNDIVNPTSHDDEDGVSMSQRQRNKIRNKKRKRSILLSGSTTPLHKKQQKHKDPASTPTSKQCKSPPIIPEMPIVPRHTGDTETQSWSSQGIACFNDYDIDRMSTKQFKLILRMDTMEKKYESLERKYEKMEEKFSNMKEDLVEKMKEMEQSRKKKKVEVRKCTKANVKSCYITLKTKGKEFDFNASVLSGSNKDIVKELKSDMVGLDTSLNDDEANGEYA
ncbi:uncharacterized protein [Clytia hemisphaerica]|uniref:uncharacterized protein n=1 Tax=Clytia hemisphaerica TaxID=252671 RepID=UPI0034D42936